MFKDFSRAGHVAHDTFIYSEGLHTCARAYLCLCVFSQLKEKNDFEQMAWQTLRGLVYIFGGQNTNHTFLNKSVQTLTRGVYLFLLNILLAGRKQVEEDVLEERCLMWSDSSNCFDLLSHSWPYPCGWGQGSEQSAPKMEFLLLKPFWGGFTSTYMVTVLLHHPTPAEFQMMDNHQDMIPLGIHFPFIAFRPWIIP